MPSPRAQCRSAVSRSSQSKHGLLAGHHDVDVVRALQAVPHRRQQGVGVRRQVDADDLGLLVDDVVDEAGVLVREAVVVLPPHVRGQQVVQRGDRRAPLDATRRLQPLRVLVDHRVDDVDERLVAAEQAVPAGEQVALEPALAGVLGEDLHHPAAVGQVLVDVEDLAGEDLVGHLVDGVQPVGRGLVRPEDPEVVGVVPHHVDQVLAQHAGGLVDRRARRGHLDRVPAVVPAAPAAGAGDRRWRAGWRSSAGCPSGARSRSRAASRPSSSKSSCGSVGPHPLLEQRAVVVVLAGAGQRDLVRAPGALDPDAVHLLRTGPALRA